MPRQPGAGRPIPQRLRPVRRASDHRRPRCHTHTAAGPGVPVSMRNRHRRPPPAGRGDSPRRCDAVPRLPARHRDNVDHRRLTRTGRGRRRLRHAERQRHPRSGTERAPFIQAVRYLREQDPPTPSSGAPTPTSVPGEAHAVPVLEALPETRVVGAGHIPRDAVLRIRPTSVAPKLRVVSWPACSQPRCSGQCACGLSGRTERTGPHTGHKSRPSGVTRG